VTVHSNSGYDLNVLELMGLNKNLLKNENHLEGYAQTIHRFKNPGHYIVKASHIADNGYTATTHLYVAVGNNN